MNDEKVITARLELLFLALIFSTEKLTMFTTGERICINQERAALFDQLNMIKPIPFEEKPKVVRVYAVPEAIEIKIQRCCHLISESTWTPSNHLTNN